MHEADTGDAYLAHRDCSYGSAVEAQHFGVNG